MSDDDGELSPHAVADNDIAHDVSQGTGTSEPEAPVRRTVLIGEGAAGVPGSGGPSASILVDPLLAPNAPPPPPRSPAAAAGDVASQPGRVGTIVIDAEDELPEAIYIVTDMRTPEEPGATGPRVDPRMKARRLAVNQARGRRRLWWVVAIAVVLLIGLGALAVFSSSLFDIEHVRLTGAVNSDPQQVAEITDDLLGKPILTADLTEIEERLEQLPWVERAQVRMDFPHTVVVQLSERTPVVGFQSADSRWRVIDTDGRVIAVLAGRPIDYPAVFGPGPDLIAGEIAPAQYAKIAQFTTAIPPLLRPRVLHFQIDDGGNVTMVVNLGSMTVEPALQRLTQVDLCAADKLNVEQLVALTAFIQSRIDAQKAPPVRITACAPDLVTTSDT